MQSNTLGSIVIIYHYHYLPMVGSQPMAMRELYSCLSAKNLQLESRTQFPYQYAEHLVVQLLHTSIP